MELIEHQWIKEHGEDSTERKISKEHSLDVINNLQDFRGFSVFQKGVLAFIANLKANADHLETLREVFL